MSTDCVGVSSSADRQDDDDVVVMMNHDNDNVNHTTGRNSSNEQGTKQHNNNNSNSNSNSKNSLDHSAATVDPNNLGQEQVNYNGADDNDDDENDGGVENGSGSNEEEDSNNNSDDNNDDPSGDEDDTSNADDSDSPDDDDDKEDEEEEGGLSALEKRRFERIQRNNEVLSSLGLGDLKKSFVKPKQQRPKKEVDLTTDRRTSSRSSKKQVNYADMPLKFQYRRTSTDGSSTMEQDQSDQPRKTPKRGENDKDKRLERFIYHEFMRIRSSRRHDVKMAEKQLKWAHTEHRFASKRASLVTQRMKRKQEVQKKQSASLEWELRTFGVSLKQLLHDADKRQMELHWALAHFQQNYVSPEQREQLEKQRLEQERKMELIDAMNGFPIALKDAVNDLNFLLVERAPKDPLPPRQSDRKRRDTTVDKSMKQGSSATQTQANAVSPESVVITSKEEGEWRHLVGAIAAEQPSKVTNQDYDDEGDDDAPEAETKPGRGSRKGAPKRKNRNVGGWVSPTFARMINRSWLEVDHYEPNINFSTFVPQAGDIVMYYPSGHRDFLKHHPDLLGKKMRSKARMPLWDRARKEKGTSAVAEAGSENENELIEKTTSEVRKHSDWWDEEWLAGIDSEMGSYPLICRVERTHAEFPPDLDAESEVVMEQGVQKVIFKHLKANKKNKDQYAPLHLAVVLKPLTPLVPPEWDSESGALRSGSLLNPPPSFQAVTFPSSKCAPYIIPFASGYRIAHSLSFDDKVKSQIGNQWRGVARSFSSVGERYGSGRLEDNAAHIASLLAFFKEEGSSSLILSLESSLTLASGQKSTLPLAEVAIVIETLVTMIDCLEVSVPTAKLKREDVEGRLITLIRGTLPLWKGVSVVATDRKSARVCAWDLVTNMMTSKSRNGGAYTLLKDHGLADNGLVYTIDEGLRAKVECSLDNFRESNQESHIFWDAVTDSIAPSYSCAVPQGMCFRKILQRLACRKKNREERTLSYYRTVDSLLNDVGMILDNCMLYNSPDSEVVLQGCRVIPHAKRLIEQVVSQHQKERTAREKFDEERRQKIMKQYKSAACVESSPTITPVTGNKVKSRRSLISNEKLNQGPFMEPLHRNWIERTDRDSSWSVIADSAQAKQSFTEWIPQSGDIVLYSRSLHADFIRGHQESLLTDQCSLPQFVVKTNIWNNDGGIALDNQEMGATQLSRAMTPSTRGDGNPEPIEGELLGTTEVSFATFREGVDLQEVEVNIEKERSEPSISGGVKDMNQHLPSNLTETTAVIGESQQPGRANNGVNDDATLVQAVNSQWLVARVVSVSRVFPRNTSKTDKEEDTFDVRSPLLCIGLSFQYEWSKGQQTHKIYWRPCMILKTPRTPDNCKCAACGCHLDFAFLFPAWLYRNSQEKWFSQTPVLLPIRATLDSDSYFGRPAGLDRESVLAINRCFNTLKRRCLTGIPPDFVPESLTLANVKKGWNPPTMMGNKALPTFEHLFGSDGFVEGDRCSNRAVAQNRKWDSLEEQEKSIAVLADVHYLPPFSKVPVASKANQGKTSLKKQPAISSEESMCPSPKLSLELVQQRLRNGYYRHRNGLIDDLQEAYVTSVLLVLSKQTNQKFGPNFSLRKVAKSLSKRGITKNLFTNKAGMKAENEVSTVLDHQSKVEEFWIEKLHKVRSLYAMALMSVSATRYVTSIFGITTKKTVEPRGPRIPSIQEQRINAASQKLSLLLAALSRDPCMNRVNPKSFRSPLLSQELNAFPSVTLKLVSRSKLSDDKYGLPQIVFSPQDYNDNDRLVRCFFGKPGCMDSCCRCQVYRRTMLACRVQRGHSNPDFSWEYVMGDVGGLDGLLHTLRTGNHLSPLPSEKMTQHMHLGNVGPIHPAQIRNEAQTRDEVSENDKDALEQLDKASRSLCLAQKLLDLAKSELELPPRLTDEFIRNSFPVDPADGHYNYCSICGLSGDVICCDKCPIVMHPRCAGTVEVPEGDWFCPKCSAMDEIKSKNIVDNSTSTSVSEDGTLTQADFGPIPHDSRREGKVAVGLDEVAGKENRNELGNMKQPNVHAMRTELEKLLTQLRSVRHAQNPSRYRAKEIRDDDEQSEYLNIAPMIANVSIDDAEPESDCQVDETGEVPGTRSRRKTNFLIAEHVDNTCPRAPEAEDESQPIGVGSKVSKQFGNNGRFLGVVTGLPTVGNPFYRIRYEDGDEEDMDEAELRSVLIFIKEPNKRTIRHEEDEAPRKRGRRSSASATTVKQALTTQSRRAGTSVLETGSSSPPDAFKVEYKPGVRVVPKKKIYQGKVGTIVRSVARSTWEVKFDDGRNRGPFTSQQLTFIDDGGGRKYEQKPQSSEVGRFKVGVRVGRKWQGTLGTIVKAVGDSTWDVKFDDGVDRGTFTSRQLFFADDAQTPRGATASEAYGSDKAIVDRPTGSSKTEFKPGVRVLPKTLIYRNCHATIVRSIGRHTWELKFDDGVDRGRFTSQQLFLEDDAPRLPPGQREFRPGVRVLPKQKIFRGKFATIATSVGKHKWKLDFDDGEDRGIFNSQQLIFIADAAPKNRFVPISQTGGTREDLSAGARVVSKMKTYFGQTGTILKSIGPHKWIVEFDEGKFQGTFTSEQLARATTSTEKGQQIEDEIAAKPVSRRGKARIIAPVAAMAQTSAGLGGKTLSTRNPSTVEEVRDPPRKRGRPRTRPDSNNSKNRGNPSAVEEVRDPPRKRGRPKTRPDSNNAKNRGNPSAVEEVRDPPRKRGRPRTLPDSNNSKNKRQRKI